MRQLITIKTQEYLIECDSPECDYKIKNENQPIEDYLNKPCPKCKENLLTEPDLIKYTEIMKLINFINKWFSWLTIFSRDKKTTAKVKIHKGIKITENK